MKDMSSSELEPIGKAKTINQDIFVSWIANSVDPDQPTEKPADLDLHCLEVDCVSEFKGIKDKSRAMILLGNYISC